MFIEGIRKKDVIAQNIEDARVALWHGLSVYTNGGVTGVHWEGELYGTVDIRWIRKIVKRVEMGCASL